MALVMIMASNAHHVKIIFALLTFVDHVLDKGQKSFVQSVRNITVVGAALVLAVHSCVVVKSKLVEAVVTLHTVPVVILGQSVMIAVPSVHVANNTAGIIVNVSL